MKLFNSKIILPILIIGMAFSLASSSLTYTGPGSRQYCPSYSPSPPYVQAWSARTNKSGRCIITLAYQWLCTDTSRPWDTLGWDQLTNPYPCEGTSEWIDQSTVPGPSNPATVASTHLCTLVGSNGWCRAGGALQINGSEPLSGYSITDIEGTQNGSSFTCAGASCTKSDAEGTNTFQYWAKSSFGDTSYMGNASTSYDPTPPTISLNVSAAPDGSNGWYRSVSPILTVTGTDLTSGLAMAAFTDDLSSTKTISVQGSYAFQYFTRDNAGNQSEMGQVTIKKDTSAPTASLAIVPAVANGSLGWYISSPTVSIVTSDLVSGVASALLNTGTASSVVTTEGSSTFTGTAVDIAGNSVTTPPLTVKLDTVKPTISVTPSFPPDGLNGWYVNNQVLFTLGSSDATSGVKSAEFNNGLTTYEINSDGIHLFTATVTDSAGNIATLDTTAKRDTTPPTVSLIVVGSITPQGWYKSASVSANGVDLVSGVQAKEVSVDGGPWTSAAVSLTNGIHSVVARTTNGAGLTNTSKTESIQVDSVSPLLTFSSVPSSSDGMNGWFITFPLYSLVASDSISGLKAPALFSNNNPTMSFASDGVFPISASVSDNADNATTISDNVSIDTTPPSISIITSPDGTNGWYVTKPTLSLIASDSTSGISTALFSNGLSTYTITGADGFYSLHATAIDTAGNSANADKSIQIDTVAPTLSFNQSPDGKNGWYVTFPTFTLSANDSTSGLNGTALFNNGQPTFSILTDGVFPVEAHVADLAGNSTSISKNMSVDTTVPLVSFHMPYTPDGQNGWYITKPSITLDSSDITSGIATALFDTGNASLTVTDGTQTLSATAEDKAGNKKTISSIINVDTVLPTMVPTTSGSGSNGWYNTNITVYANASDSISGLSKTEYRINSGTWTIGDSPTVSTDGIHTVEFRATDNAGLQFNISVIVNVDRTSPILTFTPNGQIGNHGWYIEPVSLGINPSDLLSGIDTTSFRINGGTWANGTTANLPLDGLYTVDAMTFDKAGNSTNASKDIKIDTIKPSLSLTSNVPDGLNGWYVSTPSFTLTANDLLSGLDGVPLFSNGLPTISVNSDGISSVKAQVLDQAGNLSTIDESISVDKTIPDIDFVIPYVPDGQNGWYITKPTLSLNSSDATSGVQSALFGNGNTSYTLTEGTQTFTATATDKAGNKHLISKTMNVDTVLPMMVPTTSESGSNGWYNTDITVFANPTDITSGISKTEYRLDNGTWQVGDSYKITTEGKHTLDFRTTDNAGLIYSITTMVDVDKTYPSISYTESGTKGNNGWYIGNVDLSINVDDVLSGVSSTEYRVNGGSWTNGINLVLTEGIPFVESRANDFAGNISPITTANSLDIRIDTSDPTLSPSLDGTQGLENWYISNVTATANAYDKISGIDVTEYRLDNGDWQVGDTTIITTNGSHTIDFRTTDKSGRQAISDSVSFVIDKTPPSLSLTPTGTLGANDWYVGPVSLQIDASDLDSGVSFIEYKSDNGAWITGDKLTLNDGKHTIETRATDKAGNVSIVSTSETINIDVDTVAPSINIGLAGTLGLDSWYTSSVEVSTNATDGTSGVSLVEYRLDNGTWQVGTKFTVYSDKELHTVDSRVIDNAGNLATASRSFKLDSTIPTSVFVYPPEGQSIKATGVVNFIGKSVDTLSGLKIIEMSLNNGKNWSALTNTNGDWNYSWNTSNIPDGTYTVLVRASDNAGNKESTAEVQVNVGNLPPIVEIKNSWWFWESGYVTIQKRQIDIKDVSLRISCAPSHPDVVVSYDGSNIPTEIKWDKKCGDGAIAASGDYFVSVQACDVFSHCSSASGIIKIPFVSIPVPTWTPTAKPTRTPTATYVYVYSSPTSTPRATSTKMPTATSTSTPAWPTEEIRPTMNPTSTKYPTVIPTIIPTKEPSWDILWLSLCCLLILFLLILLLFIFLRRKKKKEDEIENLP